MDISLPDGRTESTPVIVLIHGGAWTGGDKSNFSFLREYLCKKGIVAVSVNYRLARTRGTGLKNIMEDMDKIIVYIRDKSCQWTFSRDAVFLAGHSAGGHIALLYAFSRSGDGRIRGVVSYCGISDLTDPEFGKYLKRMHQNESPGAKRLFDRVGFVAGRDRKMQMGYSPLFITRNIPVLLFYGGKDDIIPGNQSINLHKKMKECGFDSTLHVYPDMGHDISPYYEEIMKITEQWILDRK